MMRGLVCVRAPQQNRPIGHERLIRAVDHPCCKHKQTAVLTIAHKPHRCVCTQHGLAAPWSSRRRAPFTHSSVDFCAIFSAIVLGRYFCAYASAAGYPTSMHRVRRISARESTTSTPIASVTNLPVITLQQERAWGLS